MNAVAPFVVVWIVSVGGIEYQMNRPAETYQDAWTLKMEKTQSGYPQCWIERTAK